MILTPAANLAGMSIMTAPAGTRPDGRLPRNREGALTVVLWLLVVPGLIWAIVRLGGWERGPLVQLFAFTPYVAAGSWLPALLALGTRRWTIAAVALATAVTLTALVAPRALPGSRGPSTSSRTPRSPTNPAPAAPGSTPASRSPGRDRDATAEASCRRTR